jgi:multicomponent Na+:H+ antiporter subunit E
MRRMLFVAWLTLLWLVLWRDISLANVISGVAVALVVTTVYPLGPARQGQHTLRPHWALVFHVYFIWKMLVSNLVVAREIITPRDRIRSGIVAIPVTGYSDLVITIVANAITLTPGTLSLEVRRDPPTLYVHVMHLYDTETVRRDIGQLLRLVMRAVGTPGMRDEVDVGGPTFGRERPAERRAERHAEDRPAQHADDQPDGKAEGQRDSQRAPDRKGARPDAADPRPDVDTEEHPR